MKNTLSLIALIVIMVLTSCNNPLNKKYSEKTLEADAKEIGKSKKLSEDDAKLLVGYIMLAKLGGKDLEGKTYSEILKIAQDYKKEQQDLATKVRKDEEEKMAKLGAVLTVAMYDKGYTKEDFQEYLKYAIAFENKSNKDIKAVKGYLIIYDLFDTEIKRINLVEDDMIPAHQILKKIYTTEYNEFMDEDKQLMGKEMKDIKVVWIPEKILFEDGSFLE